MCLARPFIFGPSLTVTAVDAPVSVDGCPLIDSDGEFPARLLRRRPRTRNRSGTVAENQQMGGRGVVRGLGGGPGAGEPGGTKCVEILYAKFTHGRVTQCPNSLVLLHHRKDPAWPLSLAGSSLFWSQRAESNRGPADYESAALPAELRWLTRVAP